MSTDRVVPQVSYGQECVSRDIFDLGEMNGQYDAALLASCSVPGEEATTGVLNLQCNFASPPQFMQQPYSGGNQVFGAESIGLGNFNTHAQYAPHVRAPHGQGSLVQYTGQAFAMPPKPDAGGIDQAMKLGAQVVPMGPGSSTAGEAEERDIKKVVRAQRVSLRQAARAKQALSGKAAVQVKKDTSDDDSDGESDSEEGLATVGGLRVKYPTQPKPRDIAKTKYNHIEDEKERKRLKRLLRNRVSAQQARERKKAYLSTLETHTKEVEDKMAALEHRVATLERENYMLRQVVKTTTLKEPCEVVPGLAPAPELASGSKRRR